MGPLKILARIFPVILLADCTPKMGNPASLISDERIIGVRGDPAEAGPSDAVAYTSLVASPSGTVDEQALLWSLCKLRKPVAENTPVSQDCLTEDLPLSAQGAQVSIRTPSAACVNFGPLAPTSSGGTLRPTDPDTTGGYYHPYGSISARSKRSSASDCTATLLEHRCSCHRNSARATRRTKIPPSCRCPHWLATSQHRSMRFPPASASA